MKVSFAALDFLVELIYSTGIVSSQLIAFFNQYGLNKTQVVMLSSKRLFARECLTELNGNPELKECIIDLLKQLHFDERNKVLEKLNRALKYDGFEAIDDGNSIEIEPIIKNSGQAHLNAIGERAEILSHASLQAEIRRIEQSLHNDPSLAIGSAKEMIESVCKAILEKFGDEDISSNELPKLVKKTCTKLKLIPEDIPNSVRGANKIKIILSNLAAIAQQTAELRNLYGSGHGKTGSHRGLSPRHARLVSGAASTLALFLLETYEDQCEPL
ncbi:MAG: abortive infection family protein [Alphaproteobacteria bacterium]|nr:abortive infection family protein [Alphaproteobacteria bacterium]